MTSAWRTTLTDKLDSLSNLSLLVSILSIPKDFERQKIGLSVNSLPYKS